jgi:membrane protease YdiL (CAAX protease family)
LIFPNQFDPELTVLRNSIAVLSPEQAESLTKTQIGYSALSQFVMALLLAPILNFIPCLGEELGWRGYLLPKLAALMGKKRAVLLSGVIWGLWHAPIIAMGYNYGTGYPGFPWLGIGAMILFCLFVGSFFSWLTFRIPSAVPAIIAHGALNGMASISMLFMKGTPNPFIGPFPIGVIGGAGFILVGILCWIKLDEIKQPEVL